jgi:hypothetical protein
LLALQVEELEEYGVRMNLPFLGNTVYTGFSRAEIQPTYSSLFSTLHQFTILTMPTYVSFLSFGQL